MRALRTNAQLNARARRKTSVVFDILLRKPEHKIKTDSEFVSRFLWWNSVTLGKLLLNILL